MNIIDIDEQKLVDIISIERLKAYKLSEQDDFSVLVERYVYNIKISEAFYPILSMLEIALRNKIHNAVDKLIKSDWLLLELQSQSLLLDNEYKILLEAAKKMRIKNKQLSKGALITELSFGFWVNLCKKAYKTIIWDKKGVFEFVFPYFTIEKEMDRTKFISSDLKSILQLRNRIFHHETIINYKLGVHNYYNILEKLLFYISPKYLEILKRLSRFPDLIKQKP